MKHFTGARLPKRHSSLIQHGISKEELSVFAFLQKELPNVQLIRGDRSILHGREIDCYIPSLKLGIEYDGLKYHSDKSPTYHLYKAVEAEKAGVKLIHIWSDEWLDNQPLVTDLLRKNIGKYQKIEAKDCTIKSISAQEGEIFFKNCSLLRINEPVDRWVGLAYKGDIITVAAVKEDEAWHILGIAERRTIRVLGKIEQLTVYLQGVARKDIYGYVDRRLYDTSEYLYAGYEDSSATDPNITYTKDFKKRLEESQIKDDISKYSKVYDCGMKVVKFNKKERP